MFSTNQIVGFFDHPYLWKECINIFEFLRVDIHQGKVSSETILVVGRV